MYNYIYICIYNYMYNYIYVYIIQSLVAFLATPLQIKVNFETTPNIIRDTFCHSWRHHGHAL